MNNYEKFNKYGCAPFHIRNDQESWVHAVDHYIIVSLKYTLQPIVKGNTIKQMKNIALN